MKKHLILKYAFVFFFVFIAHNAFSQLELNTQAQDILSNSSTGLQDWLVLL